MKKIIIFLTALLFVLPVWGQVKVERTKSRNKTSFAIIIDSETYARTRTEVHGYRDALEKDGLATIIVSADWNNPEQVRNEISRIYRSNGKKAPLEGVVFIGDIPIVRVRNAQHMTTAFKMNEDLEAFPISEASVPSDRYYDDLKLTFELIEQDRDNPLVFYYKLADDSRQVLAPDFYSGRIHYPAELGGDKYEGIAEYLRKVVRERERVDRIDHMVTFAGDFYNSDCLIAWMDEKIALEEYFPLTGRNDASALKQLNFRMDPYMKFRLFDELQRPEVDIMLFNEHGSPHKQHINGRNALEGSAATRMEEVKSYIYYYLNREARKPDADIPGAMEYFKKEYGLTDKFFEDYGSEARTAAAARLEKDIAINLEDIPGLNPQPRFLMFNACYNGSFHRPGNIAGFYIFSPGRTVVAQGNTVNVLQDRWTYEMIGLLSHGVRIGQYNRLTASLEGHIIGDPAFRFAPIEENGLSAEIADPRTKEKVWREYLDSEYADFRSVALRMLADRGEISSAELLAVMKECPFATTRMECLKLLSGYNDANFTEAVGLGLYDSYELTRRNAANYAWMIAAPELADKVADVYVNYPESHRVAYTLTKTLALYPDEVMNRAVDKAIAGSDYWDKEAKAAEVKETLKSVQGNKHNTFRKISNKEATPKQRIGDIRTIRNYTYHEYVPEFLKFVENPSEPMETRVVMAEALGWFILSPNKGGILEMCDRMIPRLPAGSELRGELIQTRNRLSDSTVTRSSKK